MEDYEQLYYDSLYEIKKLKKENQLLKDELDLYKNLNTQDSLKIYLTKEIKNYYKKYKKSEEYLEKGE